jgi:hypothetical protein
VVSQLDHEAFLLAEHHYLGGKVLADAAKGYYTIYQIKGDNGLRWFRKVTLVVIYMIMHITLCGPWQLKMNSPLLSRQLRRNV